MVEELVEAMAADRFSAPRRPPGNSNGRLFLARARGLPVVGAGGRGVAAPALLIALIHPSAWNRSAC
jgi:hypothetical protein